MPLPQPPYYLEGKVPVTHSPSAPSNVATPTSLSLITSTGGLQGGLGILLLPIVDLKTNRYSLSTFDIDDFNTEVDCYYNFRQEDIKVGRKVTVHKVLVMYRDFGPAKFLLDLEAYIRDNDTFVHNKRGELTVKIGKKNPDRKIHSKFVDVMITGERPQLLVRRVKDSGPLSFISFTMVGNMSEGDQL